MKQIDQDPRDYRAAPVKGEPILVPGAGKKVLIQIAVFVALAAVSIPLYLLVVWIMGPLEPVVRNAMSSAFN